MLITHKIFTIFFLKCENRNLDGDIPGLGFILSKTGFGQSGKKKVFTGQNWSILYPWIIRN